MNLIELPDLALIAILDRLPVRDLLRCGLVCTRFYQHQRTVCLRKTSLRMLNFTDCKYYGIYVEQDELDFYQIDNFDLLSKYQNARLQGNMSKSFDASLKYDFEINEETIVQITNVFPSTSSQECILKMITNWTNSLTHLTVIAKFNARLLCDALCQLSCLKHFSGNVPIDRLAPLSILSQLKEFNCRYSGEMFAIDLPSLLNELFIEYDNIDQFGLDSTLSLEAWSPLVANRLTRLKIHVVDLAQLDSIATHCGSIIYLDLGFGSFYSGDIGSILTSLARLSHLVELKLNIMFDAFSLQPDNLFNEPNLPSLQSIKQVELRFPFDPHQLALVEKVFPNTDRLTIRISARQFVSFYTHLFCPDHCHNCKYLRSVITHCAKCKTGGMDSVCFTIKDGLIQSHNIVVPK